MKLVNLSEHRLAVAFLSRGRQWLANAKANRVKTEVLPPDPDLVENPCYTATLAKYAKSKWLAGDSITVFDVSEQLVCSAYGPDSVSSSVSFATEYNENPARSTITIVSSTTLRLVVTVDGVEVVNKLLTLVNDFPPAISVVSGYSMTTTLLAATSNGIAAFTVDRVSYALPIAYRTWWLNTAVIAEMGLGVSAISMSSVAGAATINEMSVLGVPAYAAWVADNSITVAYHNDYGIDATFSSVSDGVLVVEGGEVRYNTGRQISSVEYECAGESVLLDEMGVIGGVWGFAAGGAPYDTTYTFWHVRRTNSATEAEYQYGAQRHYFDGVEAGETIWLDFPVYRGGTEANLIAHYTLDYAFTGPNPRMISTVGITINGTRYSYDSQPFESDLNDPMMFASTYTNYFYAARIDIGGVETNVLVCTNTSGPMTSKGYIGVGSMLISAPSTVSTDKVCGVNGSISMLEGGVLELKPPYRSYRKVFV